MIALENDRSDMRCVYICTCGGHFVCGGLVGSSVDDKGSLGVEATF